MRPVWQYVHMTSGVPIPSRFGPRCRFRRKLNQSTNQPAAQLCTLCTVTEHPYTAEFFLCVVSVSGSDYIGPCSTLPFVLALQCECRLASSYEEKKHQC